MWNNKYIVVGDRFNGFCDDEDSVVTESALIEKLLGEPIPEHEVLFLIEQGVRVNEIHSAINLKDPSGHFYKIIKKRDVPRAIKRLAHKSNPENILVSYPVRLSDTEYEMELILDQCGEMFLDHMTGMHIQGMVLLEAARQSFLAVTELFYLSGENKDYYFVIKGINTRFFSFVFPLHSFIKYTVCSYAKHENRHVFEVKAAIVQSGEVCAEFDIGFTAFLQGFISEREKVKAKEAIARAVHALPVQEDIIPPKSIINKNVA